MNSFRYMMRLFSLAGAIGASLCFQNGLKAQIVTSVTDSLYGAEKGVISYVSDNAGQEQFMDWSRTLGEFNQECEDDAESEAVIENRIKSDALLRTRRLCLNGNEIELPVIGDSLVGDLYMFSKEGITLYMASLAPVYYQPTTDELVKWVRYFGIRKREWTKRAFERYDKYKDYIRGRFIDNGVPEEICCLCIIESGCARNALSRAGALGVWQIMEGTAKDYGLRVNNGIDERLEPLKATLAAARILRDNAIKMKDWTLAVAAYNCGRARVENAIKRGKTKEWQELKQHLPKETLQYIPSLLAIYYLYSYRAYLKL